MSSLFYIFDIIDNPRLLKPSSLALHVQILSCPPCAFLGTPPLFHCLKVTSPTYNPPILFYTLFLGSMSSNLLASITKYAQYVFGK